MYLREHRAPDAIDAIGSPRRRSGCPTASRTTSTTTRSLYTLTRRLLGVLTVAALLISCDDSSVSPPPPLVAELETSIQPATMSLSGAVLSVYTPPGGDAWFAGGTTGPTGGFIYRVDSDVIRRVPIPEGPLLWWITGTDEANIWAVGEGGRVLRKMDETWTDESPSLDERAILYGAWAATPEDIWAVGGSIRRDGPKGLVLRSQGDGTWETVSDPALPNDLNLYKVWGRSPNDVFFVGEGGVIVHWDGARFSRRDAPRSELLFTVHGQRDGSVVAVGGLDAAAAFSGTESGWNDARPPGAPGLNGVFVREDGQVIATGNRGVILIRDALKEWYSVRIGQAAEVGGRTLHAVWAAGTTWMVGGDLSTMSDGIILTDREPTPTVEME